MSTEVDSFIVASGGQLDVAHKSGGLTFDFELFVDQKFFRVVLPWDQFERFIKACFSATMYNHPYHPEWVWLDSEGFDEDD